MNGKKISFIFGLLAAFLAIGLFPLPATAAESSPPVIPIEIRAQAYDQLGQSLADKVTDYFKKDAQFSLVTDEPRLIVRLSTMRYQDQAGSPPLLAYSYAITFALPQNTYPLYLVSTVGVCKPAEIDTDAKDIWQNTTKLIANYSDLVGQIKKTR